LKHGEKPEQSVYPERFYNEGLKTTQGEKRLDREAVSATLGEYYLARGWDPDTGVPTPQKLKELNIL